MSYITTYTGNHFDPINPDPELINIVDISHVRRTASAEAIYDSI